MDVLPDALKDFRTKEYWDSFFNKVGDNPFEWYSEWAELRDLVTQAVHAGDDVLIPGCGTSELSGQLYDSGITKITNIDFSRVCITSMLKLHLRARPRMRWLVMDMTQMKFAKASFDAVVDKGGLDALTADGDDNDADNSVGQKFLLEVSRVLRPGGRFLCITLAQENVIDLLCMTLNLGWRTVVHRLPPPAKRDKEARFITFLVIAEKLSGQDGSSVEVSFTRNAADQQYKFQLDALFAAVEQANRCISAAASVPISHVDLSILDELEPGRCITYYVGEGNRVDQEPTAGVPSTTADLSADPQGVSNASAEPQGGADASAQPHSGAGASASAEPQGGAIAEPQGGADATAQLGSLNPRFTLRVMDAPVEWCAGAEVPCGVFMVPQGREHEWLFSSDEGRWQLVERTSTMRLIVVVLNRGHDFASSTAVQTELSPLVMPLLPKDCRRASASIPFMTTEEGIGQRVILHEVESPGTGSIIVEDVEVPVAGQPKLYRRLIFSRNQTLVQSEALLVPHQLGTRGGGAGGLRDRAKGSKRANGNSGGGSTKARPGAVTGRKQNGEASQLGFGVVDHGVLTSNYHVAMVAGLALVVSSLERARVTNQQVRVLIIGLGGGALPMFLRTHFPFVVEVVELDPTVADLARRYFGFKEDDHMKLSIADGTIVVADAATAAARMEAEAEFAAAAARVEAEADAAAAAVRVAAEAEAAAAAARMEAEVEAVAARVEAEAEAEAEDGKRPPHGRIDHPNGLSRPATPQTGVAHISSLGTPLVRPNPAAVGPMEGTRADSPDTPVSNGIGQGDATKEHLTGIKEPVGQTNVASSGANAVSCGTKEQLSGVPGVNQQEGLQVAADGASPICLKPLSDALAIISVATDDTSATVNEEGDNGALPPVAVSGMPAKCGEVADESMGEAGDAAPEQTSPVEPTPELTDPGDASPEQSSPGNAAPEQSGDTVPAVTEAETVGQLAESTSKRKRKKKARDNGKAGAAAASEGLPEGSRSTGGSCSQEAGAPYHAIFVDADAADSSLPMSCPPPVFVGLPFLGAAKQALHRDGVLVANIVTRSAAAYASATTGFAQTFDHVYQLTVDDEVNRVLYARRSADVHAASLPRGQANLRECGSRLVALATGRGLPKRQAVELTKRVTAVKPLD